MPKGGSRHATSRPAATEKYYSGKGDKDSKYKKDQKGSKSK